MLPRSSVVPTYCAVIECVATVRALVVKEAIPVLANEPVPIVVAPSLKLTVLVGTGPLEAVTVALKVTAVP